MKLTTISMCTIALATAFANADVNNGGFETGDFSGWTQFGDGDFSGVTGTVSTTAPAGGQFQAAFGPFETGGISQQVAANVGDLLTVSFSLANDPYGSSPSDGFACYFDGQLLMSTSNLGYSPHTVYSFDVTVNNADPTLSFAFFNVPDYYLLDNVSVTPSVAPTPGAAAVLGLGGFAGLRRRRR